MPVATRDNNVLKARGASSVLKSIGEKHVALKDGHDGLHGVMKARGVTGDYGSGWHEGLVDGDVVRVKPALSEGLCQTGGEIGHGRVTDLDFGDLGSSKAVSLCSRN
jgi:hypothetical protein